MESQGWILDVYDDPQAGAVLWLLAEDGSRLRLRLPLAARFYAAGPLTDLRALWGFLRQQPEAPRLARDSRRDLFQPHPLTVLSVEMDSPTALTRLFQRTERAFPQLTYYDADIPLALRAAAAYGIFPLARCRVTYDSAHQVRELQTLDTQWDLDPQPAPLRIMHLAPDCDPLHAQPVRLRLRCGQGELNLPLSPLRPLLVNLAALLRTFDPDVLLTEWGDTWLLPWLMEGALRSGIDLPLNREPGRAPARIDERSYFTYGQIMFRGAQVHLYGRLHIDRRNGMLWDDFSLEGVLETARVTALPIQTSARVSPGTGISAMQVLTALRLPEPVLVPWHKQQAERLKTAAELLRRDQGGMIYQPMVGLHTHVAEIDFVSMYPSIMVRCNISPENPLPTQLGSDDPPGLIPQTLAPLLEKRVALKQRLGTRQPWDPGRRSDQARCAAHKWLLVTCFGYLGYKNARFGRIEAHEAVTTWGREALLRAKEAAEDLGYSVLHMYVDALWVQKPGASQPDDFTPLLNEIASRTGLSIGLDGVFDWVAFLPSTLDQRAPVANRYFGVFQDGSIKMRGIEARRRDSAAFISETQSALLEHLAQASDLEELRQLLPGALILLDSAFAALRRGRVPLDKLVVGQKLSRELSAYRSPSPAAQAACQLQQIGLSLRPGQRVRFVYLRGGGVHAWDLPEPPDPRRVDWARYKLLLERAARVALLPFQALMPELGQLRLGQNQPGWLPRPGLLLNPAQQPILWTMQLDQVRTSQVEESAPCLP